MTVFHGVEAVYVDTLPRSVRVVNTAVPFIVGSAPTYLLETDNVTVDELLQLTSDVADSLSVGGKRTGFTLPNALDLLRRYGVSNVEVVNVFDADTHKTTGEAISYTFPTTGTSKDKVQLVRVTGTAPSQVKTTISAEGITGTFTVTNTGGSTTYTITTDYTYDAKTGIITRVAGGTITAGADIEVTYTYADPDKVVDADIVGATTDGIRTGLQLAYNIYSKRGYRPKTILCPGFSESSTVAVAMASIAANIGYGCIAAIDAPVDASVSEAIAGRNGDAPVSNFGAANAWSKYFYPRVKLRTELQITSTHYAGIRHYLDDNFGYWYSASNQELRNVDGVELDLAEADRENLNIAGISTISKEFGTGIKLWGNHTAQYPSDQTPYSFEAVYRSVGIINEALVAASLPFVDKPLTTALQQQILATANGFLLQEQARGAIIEGSIARYLPSKNPSTQLAAGKLVISITLMIPVPAQVIRYETELDIELLFNALADAA